MSMRGIRFRGNLLDVTVGEGEVTIVLQQAS